MELREHLAAMRQLLRPEAAQGDLTEIFRHAHSLKGAARTVDIRPIETVAHRLESLFDLVQKGRCRLDPSTLAVIGDAVDLIEDLAGQSDIVLAEQPALMALDAVLAAAGESPPAPPAAPSAAPARPATATAAPPGPPALSIPQPPVPAPAPASLPAAAPVPVAAPAAITLPAPPAPDPVPAEPAPADVPATSPAAPTASPPVSAARGGEEIVRVRSGDLDELTAIGGQLLARTGNQTRLAEDLDTLEADLGRLARDWALLRTTLRREQPDMPKAMLSLVDALDKGLATVTRATGQMVRGQNHEAWRIRQLVDALQAAVQQARLMPVEEVFSAFPRMVRELARETGRPVAFTMTGLTLEADRMILQAMKDPLMHVLRNAVGHGAHTPAERAAAGLSGETRLEMAVAIEGPRLRVTVSDDGRGLDFPRIREIAVARGLLTDATASAASPADLARLLMRDGFSTARAVDTLSGRGIGLAVLQDMVARLQGDLDIGPATPRGTRVVVSVPLSVARHDVLLVTVGDQTYALPAHAVSRMLRIRTADIGSLEGQPVVETDQGAVPLVPLARLLGHGDAALKEIDGHLSIVLIRAGGRRLGLAVDRLVDVRQAAVESGQSGRNPLASGSLMLDGDTPVLVLNPVVLAEAGAAGGGALTVATPQHRREAPRVLVVDDSITTRTLEKSILEAEGFRVRLAVDGIDALDQLRREPADLVISDVQMPRLDGFGLLRAIRADTAFTGLPVILVTSVDHPDEVRRGLDLGADAYIIKQRFDQRELLDTIGQFVEAP